MAEQTARRIAPAQGKLGVLCVGLGAVATTFIAGVENVRRGAAKPIGSLTQMGTIRLGKRTEGRAPLIRDFVPLADLKDLVFGAWDPLPDDAYAAALHAGVLDRHEHLEPIADFLKAITPMPAVFDQNYVKRLEGKNVKTGKTKRELAEALRKDIRDFKAKPRLRPAGDGVVRVDRDLHQPGPGPLDARGVREGDGRERSDDRALDALRLRGDHGRRAVRQRRPEPDLRLPGDGGSSPRTKGVPIGGKDFKTGQTMVKTVLAPMFKARMLGVAGWYSTNILGNRDGEVLDDPESFKTKEESQARRAGVHPPAEALSRAVRRDVSQGADQLLSAARGQQGRLGQHRHLRVAGLPDADQGRFPLPRLDSGGAAGARPGAVLRPGAARGHAAGSRNGCRSTSRARSSRRDCTPSTTCSSSRPSSRTPSGTSWAKSRSPTWASSTTRTPDEVFPPDPQHARGSARARDRPSSAPGCRRSRKRRAAAGSAAPSARSRSPCRPKAATTRW